MCIKLINYWDKYTKMYGQQNVKKIPDDDTKMSEHVRVRLHKETVVIYTL